MSIKKTYPMQAYEIMYASGAWGRPVGRQAGDVHQIPRGGGGRRRCLRTASNMHNTSEVLFRLCANTDPQPDSIFTKDPADVLDHATSEIAIGSKFGIDATKKISGESFKRPWPPLIRMDATFRERIDALFEGIR